MAKLLLPRRTWEVLALVFDVDGVLRLTSLYGFHGICAILKKYGERMPDIGTFYRTFSNPARHLFLHRHGMPLLSPEEARSLYLEHVTDENTAGPCEGLLELLCYLKGLGLELYVVSGYPEAPLLEWFVKHELHAHFAHIRGGAGHKITALSDLCKKAGVPPKAAAYVGDFPSDMRAAKRVGMHAVGITHGNPSREVLREARADLVVENYQNLRQSILN